MKDYLTKSGRTATPNQKKLLAVLKAKKVLLYAPLLQWYIEHGVEVIAVHRTINYVPQKIFDWFVKEVANMRRKGDAEAEKALLAEIYKLLGQCLRQVHRGCRAADKTSICLQPISKI